MNRCLLRLLVATTLTTALLPQQNTHAHSFAPVTIRLAEQPSGDVQTIIQSNSQDAALPQVELKLPDFCSQKGSPSVEHQKKLLTRTVAYHCKQSLSGHSIQLPTTNTTRRHVVFSAQLSDGTKVHQLLQHGEQSITLATGEAPPPATGYLWIGVEHIWFGFDHLLFVLCLVILISNRRKLFWTITSFTLAHSITLGLAALGWLTTPGPPVEATIALSIVLLAIEAIRHDSGVPSLTSEQPWLVAMLFGLIHGLGFAGALSDIGLPAGQEVLALALFNIGVELGQIAFVIALLLLGIIGRKLVPQTLPPLRLATAWSAGCLASYWLVERVAGFYGL